MGRVDHRSDEPDPRLQRVSDAERHQVVEALQRAAGDGRLSVEELEERLELTWAAKTYADLVPVLADLPYDAPAPPGGPSSASGSTGTRSPALRRGPGALAGGLPEHESSLAVFSEQKRTGAWRVGETHTASSVFGSVVLDLREAVLGAETTITANAVMGSVEVLVDAETLVVVDGTPILGEFGPVKDKVQATLHEGSPVVRVTGTAVMGSVVVKRQRRPGEKRPPRSLRDR